MRVFTLAGAGHYCANFQPSANIPNVSLNQFVQQRFQNAAQLLEGTNGFNQFRIYALRDVERYLFLAASHYRRALDLMIPTSSHWAHVTLYYGSWFAAHAILGMYGCAVLGRHVVEVNTSAPGNQSLRVLRIGNRGNQFQFARNGSHKRFWEAFYTTTPSIINFADARYAATMSPVANDVEWLINQRNKVNYQPIDTFELFDAFASAFSSSRFPFSLPGELSTQFTVCEGLMAIGYSFANQFGLRTDALDLLGLQGTLAQKIERLIYGVRSANLVNRTGMRSIFNVRQTSPISVQ